MQRKLGIVYGERLKLDDKDWKLLELLSVNARMPISKLARQLRLSRDTVKYRIKRLIKEQVITGFLAVLNPPKMGYSVLAWLFISLHNLTPEKEKIFVKYLESVPSIAYITTTMGRWDYFMNVFARDPGHFNQIVKSMREKFSDIIKEWEALTTIEEIKWTHFPGKPEHERKA